MSNVKQVLGVAERRRLGLIAAKRITGDCLNYRLSPRQLLLEVSV